MSTMSVESPVSAKIAEDIRRMREIALEIVAQGETCNPYYEIVQKYLYKDMERYFRFDLRDQCIGAFGFAIPDLRAIQMIAKLKKVVEIGAGSGYWAWLLNQRGVDVRAYDNRSRGRGAMYWDYHWGYVEIDNHGVLLSTPPEYALMLCWPEYEESQAVDSLKAFKGNDVIYVGEREGGCTGDDKFFRLLAKNWTMTAEHAIPTFPGIHDQLQIYHRKAA